MRHRLIVLLLAAVAGGMPSTATAQSASAQTETITSVLKRAADYVEQYQFELAAVVAEERYVQDVRTPPGTRRSSQLTGEVHRELVSDLLFVRTSSEERWIQYRDVFAVNGQPVRDRNERLLKLLQAPSRSGQAQIEAIQQESARYNIGSARRTINMPMLALVFLDPAHQARVRFTKVNPGNLDRFKDMADPADIWAIEYRENKGGTLIRGAYDRDIPSRGRLWIDARSGAILRSELIAEDPTVSDRIDVVYRFDETLQLLVPADMRETLSIRAENTRIEGRATYDRFRKFQVQTDETLSPPLE